MNTQRIQYLKLLADAGNAWHKHKAGRLGAALTFYALFALAPLGLFTVVIVSIFLGSEFASVYVTGLLSGVLGASSVTIVERMVVSATNMDSNITALVVGFIVLLYGASNFFHHLRESLKITWNITDQPQRGVIRGFVRDRARSIVFIPSIGVLFLLLTGANTFVASFAHFVKDLPFAPITVQVLNYFVFYILITVLLALLYKLLPSARITWKDVWVGALLTAALLVLGNGIIGLYVRTRLVTSLYGAAGALIALLVWMYYSAQVFFYGAELTQVYANTYGSRIMPKKQPRP